MFRFVIDIASSVLSDLLSDGLDASFIDDCDLNVVAGVDVPLSNRVDRILCCIDRLLSVLGQLGAQVVVALELVVEHWTAELLTGSLYSNNNLVITADGVVAILYTLSVTGQAAEERE